MDNGHGHIQIYLCTWVYTVDEQICKLSMESCEFQNDHSSLRKWKWKMSQIMMNLFLSVAHNRWPDIYVARTRRGRSLSLSCFIILVKNFFNCFFFKVSNYLLTLQVPLVVDEGIELPQVINTKHNLCYRIWANTFCVMWSTAGQWS